MRQRIRSNLWLSGLVLALGLALVGGDPAHATTFDLTHTDLNLPGLSILVQVTPETCLGNPCLAVQYVSSNLANTPAGIHEIFFNPPRFQLGNPPLVVSSDPPAWLGSTLKCPLPGLCQAGGFGSFDIDFTALAAEAGDLAVTLTLATAVPSFGPNDATHQADFAVALDFSGPDCHFVVSDGVADPLSAANGCSLRAAAPTPAPGTPALDRGLARRRAGDAVDGEQGVVADQPRPVVGAATPGAVVRACSASLIASGARVSGPPASRSPFHQYPLKVKGLA